MKVVVFGATGDDRGRTRSRARARPRRRGGLAQRAPGRGLSPLGAGRCDRRRIGARGARGRRRRLLPRPSRDRPTSSAATAPRPRRSRARRRRRASGRSSTSAASATTRPTSRRICAAASRPVARLASGSVPVTTLRAAMVVGAGSAAFETILALVDRLPAMICPRWVSTPTQPIALDDVVAYLAGACAP